MRAIDFYKDMTIDVELPKGYMNVGIIREKPFPCLVADTNDSANWDKIKFPLPPGNWEILRYGHDNKVVTLKHKALKRNFFSPWF